MRVIEKTNAKVILTRSEMLALRDASIVLCELDSAMDDNHARYVEFEEVAFDQEDIQLAIRILCRIANTCFSAEKDGFPIEISEKV